MQGGALEGGTTGGVRGVDGTKVAPRVGGAKLRRN